MSDPITSIYKNMDPTGLWLIRDTNSIICVAVYQYT